MVGFHGTMERRPVKLVEGIDDVAVDEQLSHQLVIAGRGCLVEWCRAIDVDRINLVGINLQCIHMIGIQMRDGFHRL